MTAERPQPAKALKHRRAGEEIFNIRDRRIAPPLHAFSFIVHNFNV
jgi:hypothetical protein